ncbi:MAG: redoxin domain-containing protein [Solirubrobacteraceae bacterium]
MTDDGNQTGGGTRRPIKAIATLVGLLAVLVAAVAAGTLLSHHSSPTPTPVAAADSSPLASNPNLDPGTALNKPAPDFTLRDQFGRPTSLSDYRGKVVVLAFNDSECTTVCPLSTTAMVDARRYLGAAGSKVALLGINANPKATSRADVLAYSRAHGMLHQWRFLTGSKAQLEQVWKAYGIGVQITGGQIDHTPALYVIDPQGRLRKFWWTQMNYSSIGQLGQLMAQEASSLLPGHPKVHSTLSYAQVPPIAPTTVTSAPLARGGTIGLGPGRARLLLFFATWDSQDLPDLPSRLRALDAYAHGSALPELMAIDEGSVEPSASALPRLLHSLGPPLGYPVAIDKTGRLADGYEVQDQPWFVLVSASGKIDWFWDVATQGWLSQQSLAAHVRAALSHPTVVKSAPSTNAIQTQLAGSPAPLAALHAQASQLLGSDTQLLARVRALRGYPIVVNAWASWCDACQTEYPLFQSASLRYGQKVAFIGADTNDQPGNATTYLAKHPISYPSYQGPSSQLAPLDSIFSLPDTIFINRAGKVTFRKMGQYDTQGSLDGDIQTYALGS